MQNPLGVAAKRILIMELSKQSIEELQDILSRDYGMDNLSFDSAKELGEIFVDLTELCINTHSNKSDVESVSVEALKNSTPNLVCKY